MLPFFKNIHQILFFKDPGHVRLKLALKTIMAVLGSIIFCYFFTPQAIVVVPFMMGFLMQIHQGSDRKSRMLTAAMAYPCFIFLYLISVSLKHFSPIANQIGLVFFAFVAFYLQRFGSRFTLFPIFAWVMYFFAMILPVPSAVVLEQNILAMLAGCVMVFVIFFYVFPTNNEEIFFANVKQYFLTCQHTVVWLLSFYRKTISSDDYIQQVQQHLAPLRELMLLNQPLFEVIHRSQSNVKNFVSENFFDEYERLRGLGMILESTKQFALQKTDIPGVLDKDILEILHHYQLLFEAIQVNIKLQTVTSCDIKGLKTQLDKFKQDILAISLTDETAKTNFWNLYLGFIQLSKILRNQYAQSTI